MSGRLTARAANRAMSLARCARRAPGGLVEHRTHIPE